jgi:hypothetical protein
MLRHTTLILLMIAASSAAFGADQAPAAKRHAATQLPPGLPRPHYQHRTTIVVGAPPPPAVDVARDPDSLLSPMLPSTPILPGSSTLPGYYGRAFDYDYQGAYYGGGPYPSYFFRLPYACGVYGYC